MFHTLIFDLDDTLIDTWNLLIPLANRNSCEAMIQAGLNCHLQDCLGEREIYLQSHAREGVYLHLVQEFGLKDEAATSPEQIAELGLSAYLDLKIPSSLPLMTGARELLDQLRPRYVLDLVTSGKAHLQEAKIRACGIAPYFKQIWIVDLSQNQTKYDAFTKILSREACPPEKILCIGNRLDQEIRQARSLGMGTCHLRYGEGGFAEPRDDLERPDFQINSLTELIAKCQL